MRTDLFDYHLPPEQVAQVPLPRGQSRLLVLHRSDGSLEHRRFTDLFDYLHAGDILVMNDTRVTARRLNAVREGGATAEVLLLKPVGETRWEALVRPGKGLKPGRTLTLLGPPSDPTPLQASIVATTEEGGRILEFANRDLRDRIASWGAAPLPPYIHTPLPVEDEERYQTVYARAEGSAAAPTAGLHFTPQMLDTATRQGILQTCVTLEIGIDTFRPVRTEQVEDHQMHGEAVTLTPDAARRINTAPGRVVAVGTTSVRVLESAARQRAAKVSAETVSDETVSDGTVGAETVRDETGNSDFPAARVVPFTGVTRLFISPGYRFQAVDALITNFHLPKSTLLMLISAFAGREAVLNAYREAVTQGYRFYSFGDAMLIL